jgi:TIR domain
MRNTIFFSYSHKDKKWLDAFLEMLAPVSRTDTIKLWSDKDIQPGQKWRDEIAVALAHAKVAVMLVSGPFLASQFIHENELPPLLAAAAEKGLVILWVHVSACLYAHSPIFEYQAIYDVSRPLDTLSPPRRRLAISEICKEIVQLYQDTRTRGPDLFVPCNPSTLPQDVSAVRA